MSSNFSRTTAGNGFQYENMFKKGRDDPSQELDQVLEITCDDYLKLMPEEEVNMYRIMLKISKK